jgi:hypothetical protein
MIYKFKSSATGDLIMLGPQGDQLLRLLGREPALKGIIEVAAMPAAIAALQAAVAVEENPQEHPPEGTDAEPTAPPVGLRQRLWPMVEMLRRAQAADAVVVWGV